LVYTLTATIHSDIYVSKLFPRS